MKNFSDWQKLYDGGNFAEFNTDSVGQLWLKTKSIIRKQFLAEFLQEYSLTLNSSSLKEQFEELFLILQANPENSHRYLDLYFKKKNEEIIRFIKSARTNF